MSLGREGEEGGDAVELLKQNRTRRQFVLDSFGTSSPTEPFTATRGTQRHDRHAPPPSPLDMHPPVTSHALLT
jgi:hypothetical protein